jgi:hypothetical protein
MCVNWDCRFAGALLSALQVASKPLDFQVCDIEQIKSDWGPVFQVGELMLHRIRKVPVNGR